MTEAPRPLRIELAGQRGALRGVMTIGEGLTELRFPLAWWRLGSDGGHVNARTEDGLQVTIAVDRDEHGTRSGGLTIGETQYSVRGLVVDGLLITATVETLHDPWWDEWQAARR